MESFQGNPYASVAEAPASERSLFIRRTYLHVAGAIAAFIGLEAAFLHTPGVEGLIQSMIGGQYSWLIVLGLFMGVSWLADKWAQSDAGPGMQYLGLGIYVVAQAVLFLPLLYIAVNFSSPLVLPSAAITTGLLVAGITATAFITRKDFSFLGGILTICGFVALGVIVASMIFGFQLGIVFCAAMALFAGGSILYTTSNVIHVYRTDQHVAASLALFSGIMLLFWYILRIFMSRDD